MDCDNVQFCDNDVDYSGLGASIEKFIKNDKVMSGKLKSKFSDLSDSNEEKIKKINKLIEDAKVRIQKYSQNTNTIQEQVELELFTLKQELMHK